MRFDDIAAIAQNTYKENLRDKILYNLVIFGLVMIGGSLLLSTLTIGERTKIIMDVGLASIELFGTLIAIFVGIGLVSKELEKRTIYTILCKPVSRSRFILGKYLGLAITLFVNVSIMGIGFFTILALIHVVPNFTIVAAVFLIFVQLLILTAFALLCSTFTTSTLSAMFTLSIYVIGHLTEDLKNLALRLSDNFSSTFSSTLLEVVYYVLPNFDYFNIKGEVVHGVSIDPATVAKLLSYGLVYTAVLLALACLIFERRDVK